MTPRSGILTSKLAPILPAKIRFSFLHRESSTPIHQQIPNRIPQESPLRRPESSLLRNDLRRYTFPRSHPSPDSAELRIYLHNPQWETDNSRNHRRMSLPSSRIATSAFRMPVRVESSAAVTRTSHVNIATDSLGLGTRLGSVSDAEREI